MWGSGDLLQGWAWWALQTRGGGARRRRWQGVGCGALMGAFDGVMRRHGAADAASYNDDATYKFRLNEVHARETAKL